MNKKLKYCLLISCYAFLLATFLLTTIVGLDRTQHVDSGSGSTSSFTIGFYTLQINDFIPATSFVLSGAAITAIVFAGFACCSLVTTLILNKKLIKLQWAIIALVLVIVLLIVILTSKPKTNADDFGWLFNISSSSGIDGSLSYSTSGIAMIVIASLIGVCYACLAFFQVKPFLFNKPTKSNKASK